MKSTSAATLHWRRAGGSERRRRLVVLIAIFALAGCRATGGDVGLVVRNVSPGAITLVTEDPGPFLFPSTSTHVIEPWKKGRCYARLALYRGHVRLTVSGSNLPAPVTYETTTSASAQLAPEIGVQISADGHVQFGVAIPLDDQPCVAGGY